MDWEKVSKKLRAASAQHAKDADSYELRDRNLEKAARSKMLSEIFYGLHAAIEAGLPDTAAQGTP